MTSTQESTLAKEPPGRRTLSVTSLQSISITKELFGD
jgi:hypothetical protein